MKPYVSSEKIDSAVAVFRRNGGLLRTRDALNKGIHPRTLYQLRDRGFVEPLERGLYRLVDAPPLTQPDLVTVARKIPRGVVCLVSALAFHGITTQIPRAVDVAIDKASRAPRLNYPPIHVFRYGPAPFREGVERHEVDGIHIQIYSPEKTLADCFKFRGRIGKDVALEALELYAGNGRVDVNAVLRYARICRVEKIMRPYMETMFR